MYASRAAGRGEILSGRRKRRDDQWNPKFCSSNRVQQTGTLHKLQYNISCNPTGAGRASGGERDLCVPPGEESKGFYSHYVLTQKKTSRIWKIVIGMHASQQLVNLHRPERRAFPHPHHSLAQKNKYGCPLGTFPHEESPEVVRLSAPQSRLAEETNAAHASSLQ